MRKKDMMMSDMICYVENPKVYKKKLLEAEVSWANNFSVSIQQRSNFVRGRCGFSY